MRSQAAGSCVCHAYEARRPGRAGCRSTAGVSRRAALCGADGEAVGVARRPARADLPQHAPDDEGVARDHRAPPRHQRRVPSTASRRAPSARCRTARRRSGSCAATASCCASIPSPFSGASASHMQALASQARAAVPRAPPPAPVPTTAGRAAPRSRASGQEPSARRSRPTPSPAGARTLFALSAPVALVAGLVYLAHAAPSSVYPCHRPAARPGRDCRACRPGLSGAADGASSRRAEVDRGRRSACAQGRQVADRHPLASHMPMAGARSPRGRPSSVYSFVPVHPCP